MFRQAPSTLHHYYLVSGVAFAFEAATEAAEAAAETAEAAGCMTFYWPPYTDGLAQILLQHPTLGGVKLACNDPTINKASSFLQIDVLIFMFLDPNKHFLYLATSNLQNLERLF